MLKLPASDSPLRELFDVADLAVMAAPGNRSKLPTLQQARANAAKTFELSPKGSIRSIQSIVLMADDSVALWQFGPKGGRKMLWNFGGGTR